MSNKYNDIINLPHHVSKKYPQMSLESRSAQFAPFAALVGYEDAIKETGRLTFERKDFDEEYQSILDRKLQIVKENIILKPKLKITYFENDTKKDGGSYITVLENIEKFNEYREVIILKNNQEIPIKDIVDIDSTEIIFY
ncbi:MAG: hypothetical protein J6D03_09375 [Clostridia bacterium]|nr:hypothetical protein [Clostridia bacterium]